MGEREDCAEAKFVVGDWGDSPERLVKMRMRGGG